ncbi:MAG: hypothetical protein EWV80_00210 [Microcystis aeruginosa Ma_QC_B_20070730_S2]|uniref:ASCH domain-containing protein n=1 Tax=Microcystis aeruginosa Ma_QC_B_20070730_S2 TaxID=2486256 RepID=A0A552EBQ6_MICAE|nr:MAG: hypothetical protein EWV80_00210 [Microcystis aeruginosa Ma_QC_B_20070730_S2]
MQARKKLDLPSHVPFGRTQFAPTLWTKSVTVGAQSLRPPIDWDIILTQVPNLSIDGDKLPLGAIVALTDLTDCLEMVSETSATDVPNSIIIESVSELERSLGDWQPQRYAWKLENVRAIEPIPCLGKQKLFTVEIITPDFSLTGG